MLLTMTMTMTDDDDGTMTSCMSSMMHDMMSKMSRRALQLDGG
jgi:hypothetical protein